VPIRGRRLRQPIGDRSAYAARCTVTKATRFVSMSMSSFRQPFESASASSTKDLGILERQHF